jgi:putative transcriptional regulator
MQRSQFLAPKRPASAPRSQRRASYFVKRRAGRANLEGAGRLCCAVGSMTLAPGFLVAAPPLGDPNFDRSVVLLAAHGPDGAFGWVINGRELMTMGELLVRAQIRETAADIPGHVRVGGPVSTDQVWVIYRPDERFEGLEGELKLGNGIAASASRRLLELVAEGSVPSSLLAVAGYAGWAPLQLEAEIRRGSWLPTDLAPELVFDVPAERLWHAAYERIGTTPIAFTTRTVGSA